MRREEEERTKELTARKRLHVVHDHGRSLVRSLATHASSKGDRLARDLAVEGAEDELRLRGRGSRV